MSKSVKYIILVIILYIFVHNPLFRLLAGLGSIKFLYLLLGVTLVSFLPLYKTLFKIFKKEQTLCWMIFGFIVFRTIVGGDPAMLRSAITAILEIFFIPLTIVIIIKRYFPHEDNSKVLINSILILGSVGALITTVCIIDPGFGYYVKYNLSYLSQDSFLNNVDFRGFGLSEDLVGSYGMIQGAILALGLAFIDEKKWFILFYPIMFLSIMLNARTGIIIAIIGLFIYIYRKKRIGSILSLVVVVLLFLTGVTYLLSKGVVSDDSLTFVMEFFDEINEVQEEGDLSGSRTYDALMGRGFIHPDSFGGMIIGDGFQIMGNKKGVHSDVGYFNQLFYGGILYCFLLYSLIFHNFKRLRKRCKKDGFFILYIFVFLIANFKGIFLLNSGGFRLISLLYFSHIYDSYIKNDAILLNNIRARTEKNQM